MSNYICANQFRILSGDNGQSEKCTRMSCSSQIRARCCFESCSAVEFSKWMHGVPQTLLFCASIAISHIFAFCKSRFSYLSKIRYCTCYNIIHGIEHIISSAGCLSDAQNQSHKNSNVQKRSRTVSDLLHVMLLALILLPRHKLHQTQSHSSGLVTCSCT